MGIDFLAKYVEKEATNAMLPVNLINVAKEEAAKSEYKQLKVILDAEDCMDRLYGGWFSDWVCGGVWNRMVHFNTNLTACCDKGKIDMTVFFNGALEPERFEEWIERETEKRKNTSAVFSHLHAKHSPPPKKYWTPPAMLPHALRMSLKSTGIKVNTTFRNHRAEILYNFYKQQADALIGHHAEYLAVDVERYFSSRDIKLTYKGVLETIEFLPKVVADTIKLDPNLFCVFSGLLGNHILQEKDLEMFWQSKLQVPKEADGTFPVKTLVEAVAKFVTDHQSSPGLDALANDAFESYPNKAEVTINFQRSVAAYLNSSRSVLLNNPDSNKEMYDPKRPHEPIRSRHPGEPEQELKNTPPVDQELLTLVIQQHLEGEMHPWVYQVLTAGEIKVSFGLEDPGDHSLTSSVTLFRPIRKNVYSMLYNAANADSKIRVKEWCVPASGSPVKCDSVAPRPLDWTVPDLRKLWLGSEQEDKLTRVKALLSCFHANNPLMNNATYVPRSHLLLCAVLRFMVLHKEKPLLHLGELNMFLATSVSPHLFNVQSVSNYNLPSIAPRPVHLAAIVMAGLENAIFANDACGAPVPRELTYPWLVFDGKVLHQKMWKWANGLSLIDCCDGDAEQVMRVEKMRQAILEGVKGDSLSAGVIGSMNVTPLMMGRGTHFAGSTAARQYGFGRGRGGYRFRGRGRGRGGGSGRGDEAVGRPKSGGRGISTDDDAGDASSGTSPAVTTTPPDSTTPTDVAAVVNGN